MNRSALLAAIVAMAFTACGTEGGVTGDDVGANDTDTSLSSDTLTPPLSIDISLGAVTRIVETQPEPTTTDGVIRIGATAENYRLAFSAQLSVDTVYSIELAAPTDSHWFASLSGNATPVLTEEFDTATAATNQPFFVFVHAAAGAPDAEITFSVTSTTDATKFGRIVQKIGLLP